MPVQGRQSEGGDNIMTFRVRSHKRAHLDSWNARMKRPNEEPLYDAVVVAILRSQGFDDLEYMPRNLYKPESLYEALSLYDPDWAPRVDMQDPHVRKGLAFAWKTFARPESVQRLDSFHLGLDSSLLFRLLEIKGDKSAGLTAYGMKKAEAWPNGILKAREVLQNSRLSEPCLAGVRTQEGKTGRLVWGYPLSMTILEALVARPIIDHFKKDQGPMAFAQKSIDTGVRMRKAMAHNSQYLSIDIKKFDASIAKVMIQCAFNALRTWFDLEREADYGIKVGELFDVIEDYFIRTPIVMPSVDGPLLYRGKNHGVPSGSYFTQFVDSFVNIMVLGAADSYFKLSVHPDEVFVLGDDLLFFTKKKLSLSKLSQFFVEKFSLTVSVEKSRQGPICEPIPFLGRTWKNGLPYRSWHEVMKRAIAPERYRRYGEHKERGAHAVIASYSQTALIEDLPLGYEPTYYLSSAEIDEGWTSGLVQYLVKEGLISKKLRQALH